MRVIYMSSELLVIEFQGQGQVIKEVLIFIDLWPYVRGKHFYLTFKLSFETLKENFYFKTSKKT